jgi:hypothetical protein
LKTFHRLNHLGVAVAAMTVAFAAAAQTETATVDSARQLEEATAASAVVQAHDRALQSARTMLGVKADDLNPDELEASIADRVPGFAGMVHRDNGVTLVRMTQSSGMVSRNGAAPTAQGSNSTSAAWVRSLGDNVTVGAALWDSRQLLTYKKAAFAKASMKGVLSTWIDRDTNRVQVVYNHTLDAQGIKDLTSSLEAAGVPQAAVVMRPGEPMTARVQVGTSLRNQQAPVAGGAQFQFNTTEGTFNCTVGVPARRNGVLGFVTASHCSERVYNPSAATQTFAPTVGSTFLGSEGVDPVGFDCSLPDTLGCREADAMFVPAAAGASSVEFGRIMLTNAGSLTVRSSVGVAGVTNYPTVGTRVSKTGRTTGTRSGTVARVCVDTLVSAGAAGTYGALCSVEIDNPSFSAGGDSGSSIWINSASGVRITGILSYGNGTSTGFSPWGGVLKELGSVTVR